MGRAIIGSIAGIIALLLILRSKPNSDSPDSERIATLVAKNKKLSAVIDAQRFQTALSQAQFQELMRLRSEVAQLRELQQNALRTNNTNSGNALSIENHRPEGNDLGTNAPVTPTLLKTNWTFSGFVTPGNSYQSLMWAMNTGDVITFLESLTPDAKQKALDKFANLSPGTAAQLLQKEIEQIKGIRLDRIKESSDDRVSFVARSQDSDDGAVRIHDEAVIEFIKVNGEWKCTGVF